MTSKNKRLEYKILAILKFETRISKSEIILNLENYNLFRISDLEVNENFRGVEQSGSSQGS